MAANSPVERLTHDDILRIHIEPHDHAATQRGISEALGTGWDRDMSKRNVTEGYRYAYEGSSDK